MASGMEFNPLKEFDRYQQPNPYQDPSRGILENVTADEEGAVSSTQQKLLQNLSGPESLIGRSIHLTSVAQMEEGDPTPNACCVIGKDKNPMGEAKKQQAYQPAYNPGYGFYQGPGAGYSGYSSTIGGFGGYATPSYGGQSFGGQSYGGQSFGGNPYGSNPYGGQSFGGARQQSYGGQSFGGNPYQGGQSFGGQTSFGG